MKKSYLLIFLLVLAKVTSAQIICANCDSIRRLDDRIYTLDTGIPAYYTETKQSEEQNIRTIVEEQLIPELHFEEGELFPTRLAMILHVETITWLQMIVSEHINALEEMLPAGYKDSPAMWKERLTQINERMDELFDKEFTLYRFTESSDKWVKGVYGEHGNDILSLRPKFNDDRDLTGSFRFEVMTDQFKLRVLSGNKWWSLNSRSWYTYQTIFTGGEGYTPYLRDTSIFSTPTSVDSMDRPYASFIYYGFSKHRIFRSGWFKMNSRFKVGTIGSTRPGGIQALIHRDLNIGAYTPNGWESQIAAGGRVALQLDMSHEYMLVSKNWLINRKMRSKTKNEMRNFPRIINISVFDEIRYGHDMTSLGGGINFSTCDFKKGGDYLMPIATGRAGEHVLGLTFNYRFTYRYVLHNSMLEGYGVINHAIDEDPRTPSDAYRLRDGQLVRGIQIHELALTLKLRHVGIVYKSVFMSAEFNLPVNTYTYAHGEEGAVSNHNTSPWNHVGTIGLLFDVK